MRAFCRMEINFDAQVQVNLAGSKPQALALGHLRRFGDFLKTENPGVERSRTLFAGNWYRDLNMLNIYDGHRLFLSTIPRYGRYGIASVDSTNFLNAAITVGRAN